MSKASPSDRPVILVVDDDEDMRDMLTEYLEFRGFRVATASRGDRAVSVAQAARPDLILMDLAMPGMDGLEATRRLKAHPSTSHIPVIVVTARCFGSEKREAAAAGCDAYVLKPVNLEQLAALLVRVMLRGITALPTGLRLIPQSEAPTSTTDSGRPVD